MFINFADALLMETGFAAWCGPMYDLFSLGGDLNGMGTPREVYAMVLAHAASTTAPTVH